jgi:multicomponent Na+:H+ antiporter subunit B
MELYLILGFMIIAAVLAVELKDLISSVIALSAVGLGLSLAFLLLKAPNLAITQLVVEILCVIILIRATINKDLPLSTDGRWFFNTISTLLFIVCFLVMAWFVLQDIAPFGQPSMRVAQQYIDSGIAQTGAPNLTTAVTLGFRNFDALGHMVVLFVSLLGVLVVCRDKGKVDGK